MPPSASAPPPNARLLLPRPSLASCVRASIARSTLAAPLEDPAERLNRFPATPFCSLTWFIEGRSELVVPPPETVAPWCRAAVVGPQTGPTVSYNPGPVHVFILVLYPQALHALCGIDLAQYVNTWKPLDQVLGPEWAAMSAAVLAAPDDDARQSIIEAFLEPRWQAAQADSGTDTGSMAADWLRRLALQAANAGWGKGVRNIERRIKAYAGQSMRSLRRLRRAEQTFLDARDDVLQGRVSWAEVAARAGYADQAHFCRETREVTGISPAELARVGIEHESYWLYRIWS
jgi:AraC-like DNA-binding protein